MVDWVVEMVDTPLVNEKILQVRVLLQSLDGCMTEVLSKDVLHDTMLKVIINA